MSLPSNAQITSAAKPTRGDLYNSLLLLREAIATLQSQELHFADKEQLFPDGTNPKFTLAFTPSPVSSLQIYRNGGHIYEGDDFTINGKVVTFLVAPGALDNLYAYYRY